MLNCLAFLFCNTSHIKHMKRGHSETEAGHHFFRIFQGGKLNLGFSAYPALSLSDVLYSYFHTTTYKKIPCISLVTRSQYANSLLRIFTFLEPPELAGLSSEQIPSMDGGH